MEYSNHPCDICGSTEKVVAGRWIFYCPKHKYMDWNMTYENEVKPVLEEKTGMLADLIEGDLANEIAENML